MYSNTKKILHLTYDMRIGGTETVIKNIIEGFAEMQSQEASQNGANDKDNTKFEMSVLCIESPLGPFGQQLVESGVSVTNLNWQGGFDTKIIKQIRQYIKTHDIDVLHCHQYTPWVYGALAAAFTKTKVIFTEHGRFYPDSSSWKRKFINPVLLKFTDHVTAISKATKQALVDYEFIPENRIEVIYNGIKPLVADENKAQQIKRELSIPNDAKVLGTVARLDPIKNQTMMIEAFAMAQKECPNSYLVIVGDGEERQKLESLVDELNIRENVKFTGYIAKPVNHIAMMDVFLLSSLSEGTSMTLLEAMSLGKPCVVTDAGGNREVIIDQVNGFVSENNNESAFAVNLSLALKSDSIEKLVVGSVERFDRLFTIKAVVQTYLQKVWN